MQQSRGVQQQQQQAWRGAWRRRCCGPPGEASASIRWFISTGRISVVVRGVFTTTVFHTCTAAVRTLYAVSQRAMKMCASTCRTVQEVPLTGRPQTCCLI